MPSQANLRAPSDRPAETRARILEAALSEFSAFGLAGARTDRIALSAGVNKALLYYYFESKENLYLAALEMISGRIRDTSIALFMRGESSGESVLRVALNHFDRILTQREFQSLMQQEMIRFHQGESGAIPVLAKRVFAPLHAMFQAILRDGVASGELIDVDWMQIVLSALGANVFFFLSAPVWKIVDSEDRYSPESLAARRKSLVEFLGQAVFVDRKHGAELAARVLADTPMPEIKNDGMMFGRKDERAQ
jgi:TetR/AcrR family transcriptional regulator